MNLLTKVSLPAEWSPQDAILLCWPHQTMDWRPILHEVEPAFVEIVDYICRSQKLVLIAHDKTHELHIVQLLTEKKIKMENILFIYHSNNDNWCRDFGPITVTKDTKSIPLNFKFNGWGEKFDHKFDDLANKALESEHIFQHKIQTIDLVLEGGSIESDGSGTLLTTTECLLSKQRNKNLGKTEIEKELKQQFGLKRILWLSQGHLIGDDTDSHIDNLARFCSKDTIVYTSCSDEDEQYCSLQAMKKELEQFETEDGNNYKLIPLNIPKPIYDDGKRLPASYVNFLITNDYVLMPTYNDKQDDLNLKSLELLFTTRQVIGIDCRSIIKQSGAIHCLTMQLPLHTINMKR